MNAPRPILLALVSLAVVFGIGIAAGRWLGSQRTQDAWSDQAAVSKRRVPRSSDEVAHALATARNTADPVDRRLAVLSLVETADPSELRRIFLAGNESDDPSSRNAAAQRWAEIDPKGFLEFLRALPRDDVDDFTEVCGILFRTWAHHDPEAAMATARTISRLPGFTSARWEAITAILADDPEKGFALAAKERNLWSGNQVKKSVWENDPARFVKAGSAVPPNSYGQYAFYAFQGARNDALKAWCERDLAGALDWAKQLSPENRAQFLPQVVSKLAAQDLEQARSLFESLPPSRERERVGPAIVGEWAKSDPQAALDWIEDKMTGGKGEAYGAWIQACSEKGLDRAADLLGALPEGNGRDAATAALASRWGEKDLKAAVAWLETTPSSAARRRAYEQLSWRWMEKDLAGFQQFISTAPAGDVPRNALMNIGYRLVDKPLDQTLAWLQALPEDRRQEAFGGFISDYSYRQKPADLVEFIGKLNDPAMQNDVARRALSNYLWNDLDKAETLCEKLPAGPLRAAAREQINAHSNLKDSEKQRLLTKLAAPAG
ncbi:MAG: hypothetical protein ACR2OZ_09345 [Verrucomicrobiales bacterium]